MKESVFMKKRNIAYSLLFILCLFGLFVSCDDATNGAFSDEESQMAFGAYSEIIDTLNSEETPQGISHPNEKEPDNVEFKDLSITNESWKCTCNGSWTFDADDSSVLNVSISAEGSDSDIILAINFDVNSEITSFYVNNVDYTDVFLEYWNTIPMTSTINYYSLYHDSGSPPPSQTKQRDESITIADNTGNLQRENYTFSGWYCHGSSTAYAPGEQYSIDEDIDLYTKWTAIPTYQISYNANGGDESEVPSSQTKLEGGSIAISGKPSSMTRPGWSFTGWVDGSGVSYSAGSLYSADENLTLYAQWQEIGYASEEGYPIITGFSVDHNQISTCDDEHFVHFTVSATAPVGELIYAKVYVNKPKDVPVGSNSSIITSYYILSPYPSYPDETDYNGTSHSGTFTMAIPTKNFNYKGYWEVYMIEVVLKLDNNEQNETNMNYSEIVEKGWNHTIQQISGDAL